MTKNSKIKSTNRPDIIWLILFIAALSLLIWKLPYGNGGDDESFYLTVAHRLTNGDKLFSDEWHLSQLYSFFSYPFVCLFRFVNGSNDGIVLASRVLYLFGHSAAALELYSRLKKYSYGAAVSVLLFMLFTPFEMMTWSYNTAALDLLALSGAILCTGDPGKKFPSFISGAAFAGTVLCCPYFVFVFILYAVFIITVRIINRKKQKNALSECVLTPSEIRYFIYGIIFLAALFFIFFFRHTDIKRLIANFSGIFSDPEHPSNSVVYYFKHFFYCILTSNSYVPAAIAVWSCMAAVILFDKKRIRHRGVYIPIILIAGVFCLIVYKFDPNGSNAKNYSCFENSFMFPLAVAGFLFYFLIEDKPVKLFVYMYIPGILYAFCVGSTSNMGFNVISMALAVADIPSVIFIYLVISEMSGSGQKKALISVSLAAVVFFSVQFYSELSCKLSHCFWSVSPAEMDTYIDRGPFKGLKVSKAAKEYYSEIVDDIDGFLESHEPGNALVFSESPNYYLMLDQYPYASYSAWLSGANGQAVERLKLYYSLNPFKEPDYIIIPTPGGMGAPQDIDIESMISSIVEKGFTMEKSDLSYKLIKNQ